jgi:hypothetical protein
MKHVRGKRSMYSYICQGITRLRFRIGWRTKPVVVDVVLDTHLSHEVCWQAVAAVGADSRCMHGLVVRGAKAIRDDRH